MGQNLLQKVWDAHTVRELPNGQMQLLIGLHLIHEVTSPQAFDELRRRGWKVHAPERTCRPKTSRAPSSTGSPRR